MDVVVDEVVDKEVTKVAEKVNKELVKEVNEGFVLVGVIMVVEVNIKLTVVIETRPTKMDVEPWNYIEHLGKPHGD